MTLHEAEQDERFEQFKMCSFMDLIAYIARCRQYLAENDDSEVREFLEAANLIMDKRTGHQRGV